MMQTLLTLCAQPSVSNTRGEREMPAVLAGLLRELPYFKAHPEEIRRLPVDGIEGGRYLLAMQPAPKKTARTLILMSHFDVVGIEEYPRPRELAFSPEEYTEYLRSGNAALPPEARADLESGNYLFGRGVCDMKWGIAAHLELLHHYAQHPDEQLVNLLFLSVPDEERNSLGMLTAVKGLARFREEKGLVYLASIVGEPDISPEQDRPAHVLHVGAAGKIMPLFYCAGKETHVGQPFRGLNPNLFTAALMQEIELGTDFIDTQDGYATPAPTCLKLSDLKEDYSVQTPLDSYIYFNVMTLKRTPQEMIEAMEQAAKRAFESVLRTLDEKHARACSLMGKQIDREKFHVRVIRFEQLWEICENAYGAVFTEAMNNYLRNIPADMDLRELTVRAVQFAHQFDPNREPVIVCMFAPPYYPHSGEPKDGSLVMRACKALASQEKQEAFLIDPCFNGLTDMSYLSLKSDVDIGAIERNFPIWGKRYQAPLREIRELNVPFINFAPVGKDAHRYTERVDLAYSFDRAPQLLLRLVHLLSTL